MKRLKSLDVFVLWVGRKDRREEIDAMMKFLQLLSAACQVLMEEKDRRGKIFSELG